MGSLLTEIDKLKIPDGEILWAHQFLTATQAAHYFTTLQSSLAWQQDYIRIAGKRQPIPRLQAWYGDKKYQYSGLTLAPTPWTATLLTIKHTIEEMAGCEFNSLLANLYRNEKDSVGWHADDEPELGANPVIASLSLGASRTFHLKHKQLRDQRFKLLLESGDLLIMGGSLQHHWQHQIPKLSAPCEPRINLTFRHIS